MFFFDRLAAQYHTANMFLLIYISAAHQKIVKTISIKVTYQEKFGFKSLLKVPVRKIDVLTYIKGVTFLFE